MLLSTGATAPVTLVSNAHCCFAPSIWRRLLMQAFVCDVVRARTKLGIAIAARRPMMATTIMISTRVKPELRVRRMFFVFMFLLLFQRRELRDKRVDRALRFSFTDCL